MKKIIFLLMLVLCLVSCSKDNDIPKEEGKLNDPIIGTWQVIERNIFYTNGEEEITLNSECSQKGRVTFSSDGVLINSTYYLYGGECIENDNSHIISQKWVRIEEEAYRFDTVFIGFQDKEEKETLFPDRVWFPEEGIMRISLKPELPNVQFSYTEYSRIQ